VSILNFCAIRILDRDIEHLGLNLWISFDRELKLLERQSLDIVIEGYEHSAIATKGFVNNRFRGIQADLLETLFQRVLKLLSSIFEVNLVSILIEIASKACH
jgi:hypothetical protein